MHSVVKGGQGSAEKTKSIKIDLIGSAFTIKVLIHIGPCKSKTIPLAFF